MNTQHEQQFLESDSPVGEPLTNDQLCEEVSPIDYFGVNLSEYDINLCSTLDGAEMCFDAWQANFGQLLDQPQDMASTDVHALPSDVPGSTLPVVKGKSPGNVSTSESDNDKKNKRKNQTNANSRKYRKTQRETLNYLKERVPELEQEKQRLKEDFEESIRSLQQQLDSLKDAQKLEIKTSGFCCNIDGIVEETKHHLNWISSAQEVPKASVKTCGWLITFWMQDCKLISKATKVIQNVKALDAAWVLYYNNEQQCPHMQVETCSYAITHKVNNSVRIIKAIKRVPGQKPVNSKDVEFIAKDELSETRARWMVGSRVMMTPTCGEMVCTPYSNGYLLEDSTAGCAVQAITIYEYNANCSLDMMLKLAGAANIGVSAWESHLLSTAYECSSFDYMDLQIPF